MKHFLLFLLFLNFTPIWCQNIELSDYLKTLEDQYNIYFSYNHTFFENTRVKNVDDCMSLENCISHLLNVLPITIQKQDPHHFIIIPKRENLSIKLAQEDPQEELQYIEYQINQSHKQSVFLDKGILEISNTYALDSITFTSDLLETQQYLIQDLKEKEFISFTQKTIELNKMFLKSYLGKGIDAKLIDHSISIQPKNLGLLAGETDGDLFQVIKNIPGIQTPSGKPGNLNFRGNTIDQSLIQIDDIPVYHSGHFLGALSPYNATVIKQIDVHRNALPTPYGGRVGGVISMTTNDEITNKTTTQIALNTIYAGATIETTLIDQKLSLSIASRHSYPEIKSPKLEAISNLIFQGSRIESIADQVNTKNGFEFGFSDLNAKLNYQINSKHFTSLSFINIQNNLFASIEDENEVNFRDLELDNWGITAKWKAHYTDQFSTQIKWIKSNFNLYSISEGFVMDQQDRKELFDNTISDTKLLSEITYKINSTHSINAGIHLTQHQITNKAQDLENLDSNQQQSALVFSQFINWEYLSKDQLSIHLGLHHHYYQPLKKFFLNPRFFGTYHLNNNLYIKSSLGTSNQFIQKKLTFDFDDFNITNQLWFLPNNSMIPLYGIQSMLGAIYQKNNWLFDLEFYQKITQNVTLKSNNLQGDLKSQGANLFVKKKWRQYESWISYALSNTQTRFDQSVRNIFYDQTHVLSVTQILNLKPWNVALSWNYRSGMPVILAEEIESVFEDRFPAQHQLDFSSSYTFYLHQNNLKSVIGLSLLNVYNQSNIVNIFQNNNNTNRVRFATEFAPNIQLNLFF